MKNFKFLPFLFSFLALFLGQVMAFEKQSAFAKEYIDYETFVHLDNESQKDVMLMIMDFAVAMESIHPDKGPYINPKTKKTVEAFKKLWNEIIISSAYAQDKDLETSDLCLYGGWVSLMVGGKCTHPMNITKGGVYESKLKKVTNEKAKAKLLASSVAYKKSSEENSSCNATQQIICAPDYFGTDPSSSNKPFCVEGNKDTINTSMACFNKVYSSDKKDEILQELVKKAHANPAAFSESLKMMYGTCMCQDGSYINKEYAGRIYDHRTCYGIIMQTGYILDNMFNKNNREKSCQVLDGVKYTDIANMSDFAMHAYNKIKTRFTSQEYNDLTKATNEDVDKNFLVARRGDLEEQQKAGICPLDFGYGVTLTGVDNHDNTYTLTASLLGINAYKKISELKWIWPEGVTPTPSGNDNLSFIVPQGPKPIEVKVTFVNPDPVSYTIPEASGKTITIEQVERSETFEMLKAVVTGIPAKEIDLKKFKWELTESGKGKITPEDDKATAEIIKEEYQITVTYDDLKTNYTVVPTKPACEITKVAKEVKEEKPKDGNQPDTPVEDEALTTFSLTLKEDTPDNQKLIKWQGPSEAKILSLDNKKAAFKDYKGEKITVTIGSASCEYSPSDSNPGNTDNEGYTIEAKNTNTTNEKADFEAVVSKDGKVLDSIPEGFSVIWYESKEKAQAKSDKKEEKKKDKDKSEAKNDADNLVSEDTPDSKTETKEGETKIGMDKTVSVTREEDVVKKVRAVLVDNNNKEVAKSNELEVEKKPAVIKQNLNNQPNVPGAVTPNLFRKGLGGQRGVF